MAQILVVEDSASLNRLMVLALESEGYTVASALGGVQAFDLVTPETELLLLDLNLQGMDGMTCLTGIIEHGFRGKVVVVSGDTNGQRMAMVTGADGFLAKPFAPEDLIATVQKHVISKGTVV